MLNGSRSEVRFPESLRSAQPRETHRVEYGAEGPRQAGRLRTTDRAETDRNMNGLVGRKTEQS